jgi:hypothetical protein
MRPMATKYVSLHVAPPARAALQRLQLDLSADVGRRLSLGDAIMAAVAVAEQHRSEAAAALTATD